jgi:hypothetical protein
MLNRRSFFSMIAGALGAIALPWKAKAEPTNDYGPNGERYHCAINPPETAMGAGALALPWAAKASVVVAGEGPSYPAGVKMGIHEGTTISARISPEEPEEYAILTKIIEKYRREWKAQRDAYLSRPI